MAAAVEKVGGKSGSSSAPPTPEGGRAAGEKATRYAALLCFAVAFAALKLWCHTGDTDRTTAGSPFQSEAAAIGRFLQSPSNTSARAHLLELTRRPHIAGSEQDLATALYVKGRFEEYGFAAHLSNYSVLLSYPQKKGRVEGIAPFSYSAGLTEKLYPEDPSASDPLLPPTDPTSRYQLFNAYSAAGEAEGEVVYANYGSKEDFAWLAASGINVTGCVALMRYGGIFRGDKVANAAAGGCVAAIIFSDPFDADDKGNGARYPNGRFLPASGGQRGSILQGAGDPLTPGWPAGRTADEGERLEICDANLPTIPSQPMSAEDAQPLLSGLGGPLAPAAWQGSLPLAYHAGPGHRVRVTVDVSRELGEIHNVIGVMKGAVEPDRYVIVGNHRDAWTFGAADPNSGTASLLEVARGLGELAAAGWRPARSIVLGSWDAEEEGLLGSTEWAEDNADVLRGAVAVLNVDVAVSGPGFWGGATPQLDGVVARAAAHVPDPEGKFPSLLAAWAGAAGKAPPVGRLGGEGTDHVAFLQHLGVPAVNLGFGGGYPTYHSIYDDFRWMELFGDPGFHRHVAMAQVWGAIAITLASPGPLPFEYRSYARAVRQGAGEVAASLAAAGAGDDKVSLAPLWAAADSLAAAASGMDPSLRAPLSDPNVSLKPLSSSEGGPLRSSLRRLLAPPPPAGTAGADGPPPAPPGGPLALRAHNDRLLGAERALLDCDGLKGRPWYKHLVYAPALHNGYGSSSFPGISDAVSEAAAAGKAPGAAPLWREAQHEVWRAARAVERAAKVLGGQFT